MLCGTEIFSTGRFKSASPATTSPHFIIGAQKNTNENREAGQLSVKSQEKNTEAKKAMNKEQNQNPAP